MDKSTEKALSLVGFTNRYFSLDESGYQDKPITLRRSGDVTSPLMVTVKLSRALNDDSPVSQTPLQVSAVHVHWAAGEGGDKVVPVRVERGVVLTKPLAVEAKLEIPLDANAEYEQGLNYSVIHIDNRKTAPYPDRTDDFIPKPTSFEDEEEPTTTTSTIQPPRL